MDKVISYNYIQIGKIIWYKNRQDSPTDMPYLLSTIKSKNDLTKKCTLINGETVQYANTLPYFNDININVDDLSILNDLNEMDILYNLLNRFSSKVYFTDIDNILLFLNPYSNKDLVYSDEILNIYDKKNLEVKNIIYMPHLYKNIYNILENLKEGKNNKETILIQGEVGTGKSEVIYQSIKYILSYFQIDCIKKKKSINNATYNEKIIMNDNENDKLNNSNESNTSNDGGFYSLFNYKIHQDDNENMPNKIIASMKIFEAFGNAKTFNNNNSTRSLKYLKIRFNKSFTKIIGGEVYSFLLDKKRVSDFEPNKGNNFNIFYYLIKCGDNDLLRKLFLFSDNITNYKYLQSSNHSIDNTSYTKHKFRKLKKALIMLDFNNAEMFTIYKIIAAILLLGNLEIKIDDDLKLIINDNERLSHICDLLNFDKNEFIAALINQEESVGKNSLYLNKDNNSLYYRKNYTYNYYNGNEEIERIKNNFANELYNQLFLWMINKINNNLNTNDFDNEGEKSMTFFDFCGYENNYSYKYNNIIYLNSLEQLFINYMNELIFYFYLKDNYLVNLQFFQKEGFSSLVDKIQKEYDNKKDILNSINYLLNEIKSMQNDKSIKLFISELEKDSQLQSSKKKFKKVKYNKMMKNTTNANYFCVHHTSEDIFYNINGFLYKNTNNFIPWNLLDCLLKSKNSIIRNIYKNNRINTIGVNIISSDRKSTDNYYNFENIINNGFVTLGEEFKFFIKEIKKEIKQSHRNYIICFKSNQNIKPLLFSPNVVFNQIKNFKILSSIKQLEKNFYPIIIDFTTFFNDYKITQDRKIIFEFDDVVKKTVDTNDLKMNDLYRKECIDIINDLINNINKDGKDKIIISEDSILIGRSKMMMKEKIYKILESEKKRRIEYKTKVINIIKVGINYIINRHNCKEYKNKQIMGKVSNIQALMKAYIEKNKFIRYNNFICFLQNSLRIICAKKKFEDMKNSRDFLLIRLKIYLDKLRFKTIIEDSNDCIKKKSTIQKMYAIHQYYFLNKFTEKKSDLLSNNEENQENSGSPENTIEEQIKNKNKIISGNIINKNDIDDNTNDINNSKKNRKNNVFFNKKISSDIVLLKEIGKKKKYK